MEPSAPLQSRQRTAHPAGPTTSRATTHRLAIAVVVLAGLAAAACERRPRDPKPPSDPGRNVPKPITATALPALIGLSAPVVPR